jgi:hypothetical protein
MHKLALQENTLISFSFSLFIHLKLLRNSKLLATLYTYVVDKKCPGIILLFNAGMNTGLITPLILYFLCNIIFHNPNVIKYMLISISF